MPQFVVVDQILVAQGNAKNPLPDQRRHGVLDQILGAMIGETVGIPLDQPDHPVGGAEQHGTGVRGHLAAVEPGHHRASFDACKAKQIRATLCLHRALPDPETNRWYNTIFSDSVARCTYPV